MPKPILGPRRRTNPLIWCIAIICTIITVAVIIAGIVIFIVYLTVKPRIPQIGIGQSQLDSIFFDQAGLLTIQVSISIIAKNDNAKASAHFYDTYFRLRFYGRTIANLRVEALEIRANHSLPMQYVVQSSPIPLDPQESDEISAELMQRTVILELIGTARTRWSAGIASVKFWLNLDCDLHLPTNGTAVYPRCSSKAI